MSYINIFWGGFLYKMNHIFLHGLGQNSLSWNKTISFLKDKQHVVCPDLYSFFKSNVVTYENLYQAFSKYCNNLSEPLDLCGLSLGAVLSLNYAIDNPKKINSLILIAPQYNMPKTLLKIQNIIFHFMPNSAFSKIGLTKKSFMELTNSMMNIDFSENIKNISCPTLILCVEKDEVNKKASKCLSENIIKSEFKLVKNANHEVNIDAPKELAEIIDNFYYMYK